MKIFRCVAIDTVTKKEMILSEASYNNACFYIDCISELHGFRVLGTETNGNITTIKCTAGLTFYYDEARGYLLKD